MYPKDILAVEVSTACQHGVSLLLLSSVGAEVAPPGPSAVPLAWGQAVPAGLGARGTTAIQYCFSIGCSELFNIKIVPS